MACEAIYLGRDAVSGPTDAKTLSSLIHKLLGPNRENAPAKDDRKYLLQCIDTGLKLESSSRRDEGFESDDSESLRSTSIGSSDEKFCNIDLVSDVETSSANSSGSDFDEIAENSKPVVVNNNGSTGNRLRDNYPLEDIVFCHTDGRIVVWVVRERTELQAVVFQCRNEETAKKLFQTYNETNRRFRLDRTRKGRWGAVANMTSSQQPRSLPMLDKNQDNKFTKFQLLQRQPPHKWNLVERVDNEGMMHLEVAGGSTSSITGDDVSTGGDSILSFNTPDIKKDSDTASSNGSVRQRQPSNIISEPDIKPERPARKNKPAPQPPGSAVQLNDNKKVMLVPLKSGGPTRKPYPKEPHVVRGQVVRVLVSNPPSQSTYSPPSQMSWWCLELAESRRNGLGTVTFWPPEIYTTKNHEIYRRRNRSKSPIHRPIRNKTAIPTSPITTSHNNNNGLSQKLKCFGEAVISKWSTNGNGPGQNIPPVLVRMTQDSPAPKSVIKKSPKSRDSISEKKVTFSAYATVQMLD